MHLRTSAILALSALSLGACISQPNSAPITSPVKDRVYYFQHLDEAKTKKEQCLKDDVFKKAGVDMENVDGRQMIAAYPDDLLMLNPDNTELLPCFAAWTAVDSAESFHEWQKENAEKEALNQKIEKQAMQFKTEWEKKYAEEDWKTFYSKALHQESVHSINTDSSLEEQAKREAIDRIFADKAAPLLNELKTKNIETLTKEIPQSCQKEAWDHIPLCKAYYHVLKEKFSEKTLFELVQTELGYSDGKHIPTPILTAAYRAATEADWKNIEKTLMSDHSKLDAEYRQCFKQLKDKVAVTQVDESEHEDSSYYYVFYPECAIANRVMEQLELPINLSKAVDREILIKQIKQNLKKKEGERPEWERLEKSPEVAKIKEILAQKYAQIPWQDFESIMKEDHSRMVTDALGTEEREPVLIDIALGQVLADKTKSLEDELQKKSIDELIAEEAEHCSNGKASINWVKGVSCQIHIRVLFKKFQDQTVEELSISEAKYEEEFPRIGMFYRLVLQEKKQKQYSEWMKDNAKREAVYRQCLKNISGIIQESDVSEEDNGFSYVSRDPVCKNIRGAVFFDGERIDFFIDTLLNKKRFQQASSVKQN